MIGPGATGSTRNETKRGSGAVSVPRRQTRSLQGTPAVRDTADFPSGDAPTLGPSRPTSLAAGLVRIARPRQWVKYVLEFVAPGAAGVCRALDAPLHVRLGR
jgi:hypothetical protein